MTNAQRTALGRLRLIWVFLLAGQIAIGAVLLGVRLSDGTATATTAPGGILALVSVMALLILTPAGYFVRNQFYKAYWQGDVVAPTGYLNGNIVLLSMLQTVGVAGLVLMFITDQPVWPGLVALLAIALQAINFPTGKPMQPHRPDFVRGPD